MCVIKECGQEKAGGITMKKLSGLVQQHRFLRCKGTVGSISGGTMGEREGCMHERFGLGRVVCNAIQGMASQITFGMQ